MNGYSGEPPSGTSSQSSPQRSRHASYSSTSSLDPINLLENISDPRGVTAGIVPNTYKADIAGLPIITWKDIRAATRRMKPKHLLAKDLPHTLQDHMNALDPYWRSMPMNRTIFEAAISENTMHDEPDAPPIRILNDIDDEPTPPWEFYYTNEMWHGEGVPGPDIANLPSCDCEGSCDPRSKTCACLKRQQAFTLEFTPDFAYDRRGRLKQNDIPIFECNDLCGCGDECRNRVCPSQSSVFLSSSLGLHRLSNMAVNV
jgi:histone-lysine N-methyltransferase SUV39H